MAAFYYLVLAVACVSVRAFPQDPLPFDRNTIFGDEKLEGEVFEHIDDFNGLTLYTRNDNPYRLPITTRPLHYDILWTIEIPRLVFSGEVNMQVYATSANVNEIVFHSKDLNIRSLSVSKNGTAVPIQDYVLQPEYQFLRVRLLRSVLEYNPSSPVIYTVSIVFDAPLRTDMNGIYRSWYRNNSTDEVRWMATTQFQSTAARSALPCYDEPGFKATFAITIRRPSLFRSWSCTRIRETRPSNITGYAEDEFHPTPVMSTYLLAIIVAEYESLAQTNNGTLLYEVIARPSAINTNQGDYAFDVGQRLLARMSNHTDYDFYAQHPHLKMTQAAIPDFSAGAMENWGLLTYREAYLMYDENHTNSYFKQLIAYILSHEIAHMWFGNVVTCDWWDVLWLNEGFARYYQYFLTDWVEEHLGLRTRFINEQMHTALLTDSANNPHPLSNTGVGSPGAVSAMFSTLTYNKGAAIIRMTEHLLGFDVHREGLRKYLADRKFETAQPIHLFQALQDAALASGAISEYGPGFSVIDYYRSWTEQGGHPVLNVQVDHKTGLMTINQRRFNINSGYSAPTTNWIIPITFATASNNDFNNTKPTHIITGAISIINRTTVGDEWVIFNKQQTGFYRVNYDDYTWDLITIALRGPQRTVINEFNKAQIVNDVFQFARSGLMSYNKALSIISFLEFEIEYTPWVAAITGFNWVRNRLIGTPLQARFEDRFRSWATNVMSSLTYYPEENESFMRSYQRYQLAPFLCQLNASECRAAARAQFDELRLNNTEVPVDSRHWVYCNALRDGRPEDFDFLWARYLAHNVYTEKILLLQNLGCTSHEQSLYRFLDAIVQDNFVIRPQDYTSAFSSAVNGNEGNTQIVFKYIKENLVNMTQAFGSPSTPLSYISSRLRSQQQIEEFEQWADDNREQLGTVFQSVRNGAQTSRNALQWAASVQADIDSFLNGEVNVQTTTSTPVTTLSTTTLSPPALVEPVTPEPVPGSANAAILSALVIVIAFVLNLAL